MFGEREVRRWIRLVTTLTAGDGKSSELVTSAMVRARFCELISPRVPSGDSDLFLMGLLSMVDVILEMPMARILDNHLRRFRHQGCPARRRQPPAPALRANARPRIRRLAGDHPASKKIRIDRKRSRRSLLARHAVGPPVELRVVSKPGGAANHQPKETNPRNLTAESVADGKTPL